MEIIEVNPIVVYKNHTEYILSDQELSFLDALNLDHETNRLSSTKILLDQPELISLRTVIESHIKRYQDNVCSFNKDAFLEITESWYSKTESGRDHDTHNHPNSLLSGVFYIDAPGPENECGIHLQSDRKIFQNFHFEYHPENLNKYNTREIYVPVKSGDIVLFPSWMYHYVSKNNTDTPRKVVAFNTFLRGKLSCYNEFPNTVFI